MKPTFFPAPADFRRWLAKNHLSASELLVGFYKKDSGKPSITWPESVDEALCFGWIDSIRRSIDEVAYSIRFTPRKPGSTWSAVNIRRVEALKKEGRMQPAGLKAYESRRENKSGIYSYEQRSVELEEPYRRLLRKSKTAWEYFQAQPPSYRKVVHWWIVSAKQEETRLRRLEKLVTYSEKGQRLPETLPKKTTP
jgi:uncharacterized protein YdeI (YjbR/CyaY-like superfamily)